MKKLILTLVMSLAIFASANAAMVNLGDDFGQPPNVNSEQTTSGFDFTETQIRPFSSLVGSYHVYSFRDKRDYDIFMNMDIDNNFDPSISATVPEPASTGIIVGMGLCGLLVFSRKNKIKV